MRNRFGFRSFISRGIRRGSLFFLSFGFALLFLMAPAASAATTWKVTGTGDSSTTTSCADSSNCATLRSAIVSANADTGNQDTIDVTATGTIDLNPTYGAIDITNPAGMTITGPGANNLTVSGGGATQIFNISAGPVKISGLTLADGSAEQGGAIEAAGGVTLTVEDCVFSGNSISATGDGVNTFGGAIYSNGALTVTNCTFSGNQAIADATSLVGTTKFTFGGAIYTNSGALTITGSTFEDNQTVATETGGGAYSDGGAIYTNSGALTITGSTFSGNSATGIGFSAARGGAISDGGATTVANSTFDHNQATAGGRGLALGGAIENGGGPLTVTNSTFSGNSATGAGFSAVRGGAISNAGALTVTNDIFSGNSAGIGSAIYNDGSAVTESYNIYYENYATGTNNENDAYGFTLNADGTDLLDTNPSLTSLGNYGGPTETMMPEPGSAAICAGDASALLSALGLQNLVSAYDQRGFPASPAVGACANGNVDIGAVQTNYLLVTSTSSDSGKTGTLPYEVTVANGQPYADIGFSLGASPATINLCPGGGCGSSALLLTQGNTVMVGVPGMVTISGNKSVEILYIDTPSTAFVSLYGLTVENGAAAGGGAIELFPNKLYATSTVTLVVTDCTFSGNSASDAGGAIYTNSGALTITGSTFSGNSAGGPDSSANVLGGAIRGIFSTLTITDSTFYDNQATGLRAEGGAIDSGGGPLTVTNSTFDDNQATVSASAPVGSGSAYGGAIFSGGALTVVDDIFADNQAGTAYGAIFSDYATPAGEENNFFYNNAGGNGLTTYGPGDVEDPNTNPSPLAPLASYGGPTQTMLPLPSGAANDTAICRGTPALPGGIMLPAIDQRGFPRLNTTYDNFNASNPCIDIGAVQTNYQSIQFTNAPSGGYFALAGGDAVPAPNVSVTENGQNIGGVPVTITVNPTPTAVTGNTATTVANQGATFDALAVSPLPSGYTLSSRLDITPSISIVTSTTPALTFTTADLAAQDYLSVLYSDGVLNSGQYNSLLKEWDKALSMASDGKTSGAIKNFDDFIAEVNDLYSSGVLTQQEEATLVGYAKDMIHSLQSP